MWTTFDMGKAMTGTFEITFPQAPEGHTISMEFGDKYTLLEVYESAIN